MYLLGILVFSVGFFLVSLFAADGSVNTALSTFYDLPTTFAFIFAIASVIISTDSFKIFISALNALLSKKYYISAADKEKAIRLLSLLRKTIVYATVLITVLGLILTLMSLSDPTTLGPKIAISICSIIQGSFINLILINPAIHILQARYNVEEKTLISEKQVIDKILELCYKQGVSPEEILNATEITFKSDLPSR